MSNDILLLLIWITAGIILVVVITLIVLSMKELKEERDIKLEHKRKRKWMETYHIRKNSIQATVNIYYSLSKEEAFASDPSIKSAWRIGKRNRKIGTKPTEYFNKRSIK